MSYSPPPSLPYISELIEKYQRFKKVANEDEQHAAEMVLNIVIDDLEKLKDELKPERYKDR